MKAQKKETAMTPYEKALAALKDREKGKVILFHAEPGLGCVSAAKEHANSHGLPMLLVMRHEGFDENRILDSVERLMEEAGSKRCAVFFDSIEHVDGQKTTDRILAFLKAHRNTPYMELYCSWGCRMKLKDSIIKDGDFKIIEFT